MGERPESDDGGSEPPRHVPPPKQGEIAGWYRMSAVGTEFIAAIGGMALLGWFLDRWLGTAPWLLLIGCGVGFAVGLWLMYKAARDSFR